MRFTPTSNFFAKHITRHIFTQILFHSFSPTFMASAETTPSKFVPRVLFPIFIVLGVSAVAYFGLRQCDCDDANGVKTAIEKPAH
jgi:hypothetical protein